MKLQRIKKNNLRLLIGLWESFNSIDLNKYDDNPKQLLNFIKKNKKLNYCIFYKKEIIASILCGQDGRRGTIYHLAVKKNFQHLGLAKQMINKVCTELKKQHIYKVNITVFTSAIESIMFWEHIQWQRRKELYMYSLTLE